MPPFITLDIQSNVDKLVRNLNDLQKKQVPFATAKALTKTAQDVQKAEIQNVQRVFNNKKKWWGKQQPTGIKIKPATKRDLTAIIFTKAHFAQLHESGGIKRPFKGRSIAIPTDKTPKTLRKSGGVRKASNQKRTFWGKLKTGERALFKKVGGKKQKRVQLIFVMEKSAKIKPTLGFKKLAERVARKQFKRRFNQSFNEALKTAKRK